MIPRRTAQKGVSLIEVLVAVIVFSIGLLGLAGLQMNALKFNESAAVRGHAVFLAEEMADRIRSRPASVDLASYAIDFCGDSCAPALADHVQWMQNLGAQLPAGNGSVEVVDNLVTITVRWSEGRLQGSEAQTISLVTRM